MKAIIFIYKNSCVFIIFFLLILNQLKSQEIVITGIIENKPNDSIRIRINPFQHYISQSVCTDANGYFNFTFTSSITNNYVSVGNSEILVMPGDSIYAIIKNDTIIKIKGSNANYNKILLLLQNSINNMVFYEDIDARDFLKKINDWYSSSIDLINTNYANSNITNENKKWLETYITMMYISKLYGNMLYLFANNEVEQYNIIKSSSDFNKYKNPLFFNNTLVSTSNNYLIALIIYIRYKLETEFNNDKSYLMNFYDIINSLNLKNINIDIAYSSIIFFFDSGYLLKTNFFEDAESIIDSFRIKAFIPENAEYLSNYYNNEYSFLKPNMVFSNIEVYDTSGNNVSLLDYSNKVLYIKIWNLGCKSCINAIPEFNKLISEFNDTNIVFISILLERKIDDEDWKNKVLQWKKLIKKLDLKGDALISRFESKSGIAKYSQSSTSVYFILGKNNEIINLKAPSPYNSDLKALLWDVIYKN